MTFWKRALLGILSTLAVLSLWLCLTRHASLRVDSMPDDDAAPVVRMWRAWRSDGAWLGAPKDWLARAEALLERLSDGATCLLARMPSGDASTSAPSTAPAVVDVHVRVSLRHLAVAMALLGLTGVGAVVLLIEHALLARIHAQGRELTRSGGAGDLIRFP